MSENETDADLRNSAREAWDAAVRANPSPTVHYFQQLLADNPSSAFAAYQCARAHDYAGDPQLAAPLYERAFEAGLSGTELRRGLTSYGSTLRNLGRNDEAITALENAHQLFPDDVLVICYLALALHSGGQSARAIAYMLDMTMAHQSQPDLDAGRWALGNYTAALIHGEWSPDGVTTLELTGPLLETTSADRTAAI